jgi:hypothetical protein
MMDCCEGDVVLQPPNFGAPFRFIEVTEMRDTHIMTHIRWRYTARAPFIVSRGSYDERLHLIIMISRVTVTVVFKTE